MPLISYSYFQDRTVFGNMLTSRLWDEIYIIVSGVIDNALCKRNVFVMTSILYVLPKN